MLNQRDNRRAFTIFELLAVITVLAVLLTLLVPALRQARETGKRTRCAANVKQIATGHYMYAIAHANKLPIGTTTTLGYAGWSSPVNSMSGNVHWSVMGNPLDSDGNTVTQEKYRILNPFIVDGNSYEVFRCPSEDGVLDRPGYHPDATNKAAQGYTLYEGRGTSYSYITGAHILSSSTMPGTEYLLRWTKQGCWGRRLTDFVDAGRQVMTAEFGWIWGMGEEWDSWWDAQWFLPHDTYDPVMNMGFVDGHVQFQRMHTQPNHWFNNGEYEFAPPG